MAFSFRQKESLTAEKGSTLADERLWHERRMHLETGREVYAARKTLLVKESFESLVFLPSGLQIA